MYGYGTSMMGPLSWVFMLLFWGIVILGVIFGVRWLSERSKTRDDGGAEKTALDALKMRYARGEITSEEFERMKKDLE